MGKEEKESPKKAAKRPAPVEDSEDEEEEDFSDEEPEYTPRKGPRGAPKARSAVVAKPKKKSQMRNQNIHRERDLEELPRRAQQLWLNLRRKLPPRNPRRRLRNPLEKRQRQRNRRSSEETKNC